MSNKIKVLFVCLGNICRSPIAEAVFQDEITKAGLSSTFVVDSAALGGWHVGLPPDTRASATLKKYNIEYGGTARQICEDDFNEFDYIFGMDMNNIAELNGDRPTECKAKIQLFGNYDPEGDKIIKDPYYDSGSAGFEKCYQQCVRCSKAFLDSLSLE